MTDLPLISVVLPTYNRAPYLKRALNSVVQQTYQNLEIIIVDDCSEDNTFDVVTSFSRNDKRIILLRNDQNRGLGFNKKWAMDVARGDFFAFLDDDDEWFSNKIEFQFQKSREVNGPALFLCNGYDYVRNQLFSMHLNATEGLMMFGKNKFPMGYALPNPSHWFFSRKVYEMVGAFDPRFRSWADYDYLMRIFLNQIPIFYANQLLVKRHRIQNEKYLSQSNFSWLASKELFIQKHFENLRKDNDFLFRAYYSIGKDYFKMGENQRARRWFIKAWITRPSKVEILNKALKTFRIHRRFRFPALSS